MYGVSKISSEQNIMLTTFPAAQYSAQSLAEHLEVFAKAGIVVDMICQSAPRGTAVDFSFTTAILPQSCRPSRRLPRPIPR